MQDKRSKIPSIDSLLRHLKNYPHNLAKETLVEVTGKWRKKKVGQGFSLANIEDKIIQETIDILERNKQTLKKVINATGVILNTNLGRAPLPKEAINGLKDISCGYTNLEIDIDSGERGDRSNLISALLHKLTGAEDSLVVNNNAAAVFLILDTFAKNREVICSRGELIEIGGSFRLPDILANSGCSLVEVGTTNRTYIDDYERAINNNTAILLRTHTSNYKIVGFTHTPSLDEVVKLGSKKNILTVEDMGSGTIIDLRPFGLPYEPTVKEIVDTGIDLVCFSGDKLLGGPQAGIIVGKKELIMRIKKNPLYRILRVGKHILCLLEQVIRVYLYDTPLCGEPLSKLPHLFMMTEPLSSVKSRADKLCAGLSPIMGKEFTLSVVESLAEIGGGSYPGVVIPSFAVAISSNKHTVEKSRLSRSIGGFGGADKILASLRSCLPPIVARIVENKVLLDAKTIFPDEISQIVEAVAKSLKVKSSITG